MLRLYAQFYLLRSATVKKLLLCFVVLIYGARTMAEHHLFGCTRKRSESQLDRFWIISNLIPSIDIGVRWKRVSFLSKNTPTIETKRNEMENERYWAVREREKEKNFPLNECAFYRFMRIKTELKRTFLCVMEREESSGPALLCACSLNYNRMSICEWMLVNFSHSYLHKHEHCIWICE